MKNLHILPIDKLTKISISEKTNTMVYNKDKHDTLVGFINQNIYITSDEEIRVGDWYINTFVSEREQEPQTHTEKRHLINHQKDYRFKYCKKIILTTDQDLIKDGVQAIDDEFLEWFVKNPSCEWIEVKSWIRTYEDGSTFDRMDYEIITPKEEPKQETLEEVAKRLHPYEVGDGVFDKNCEIDIQRQRFIEGVKWKQQQERMYSEEDMKKCWKEATEDMRKQFSTSYAGMTFEKWFEKIKNK